MAKYFIDTEFVEGPQKKRFFGITYGETKPTIDLISLGMVCEDGRELYCLHKDFNIWEAWNRYDLIRNPNIGDRHNFPTVRNYWLRENVLWPIYWDLIELDDPMQAHGLWSMRNSYHGYKEFKRLIKKYGKTRKQIMYEINQFICPMATASDWADTGPIDQGFKDFLKANPPKFYAYFADYDWVAFCWIYGKMMDLPEGFPMYCQDLKQTMDSMQVLQEFKIPGQDRLTSWLKTLKSMPGYPKQENEHSALADAHWNKALYDFLQTI